MMMIPIWVTSKLISNLFKLAAGILLVCIGIGCIGNYYSITVSDVLDIIDKLQIPRLDILYNILHSFITEFLRLLDSFISSNKKSSDMTL